MTIIRFQLPDDVARRLEASGRDPSQRALEALALEAYRSGEITSAEVERVLNLSSRWETDDFLERRQAHLDYSEADLEQDIVAIRQAAPR